MYFIKIYHCLILVLFVSSTCNTKSSYTNIVNFFKSNTKKSFFSYFIPKFSDNINTGHPDNTAWIKFNYKIASKRQVFFRKKRSAENKTEDCCVQVNSLFLNETPVFSTPDSLDKNISEVQLPVIPFEEELIDRTNYETVNRIQISGELKFLEVPPGGEMKTPELEIKEGYTIFNFLSYAVIYLQISEFPYDLVKDWVLDQLSFIQLLIAIFRVEAGIISVLILFLLLAIALPIAVLAHSTCLKTQPDSNRPQSNQGSEEDAGQVKYGKVFCVIFLELLLILLPFGIVGMFFSNEHMSNAVQRSPDISHAAIEDLNTFVRNTRLQIRFVTTTSMDQGINTVISDLDDIEKLLGRPIQRELATETGVDVALDALSDICSASNDIASEVLTLRADGTVARELARNSQEKLNELRNQVESTIKQCFGNDKLLCDTIDTNKLDISFRIDSILAERKLSSLRQLAEDNLTNAVQDVHREYYDIPQRIVRNTLVTRRDIQRNLMRQRDYIYKTVKILDDVSHEFTTSIDNADGHIHHILRSINTLEKWRWIIELCTSLLVLLIWILLTAGVICGHCGLIKPALYILVIALILICITSIILWVITASMLLIGGNGEMFMCQPLYDKPNYKTLSLLINSPGILFKEGGLFSNILKGNKSMNVPIHYIIRECRSNQPVFPTFHLNRILNIDSITNHLQWSKLHEHISQLKVKINDIQILKPMLQTYLQEISVASGVNLTFYRSQISGPVTTVDLNAFADQLDRIASQMKDFTTSARMESLASRSRKLFSNNLQSLERHRDDIVYKLASLELHLLPLQRQANQSLSHLKTIQYYLINQGSTISDRRTKDFIERLIHYLERSRAHVLHQLQYEVALCRPIFDVFNLIRVQLCKHIVQPMNVFWISAIWCLALFIISTPILMVLIYNFKHTNEDLNRNMSELLLVEPGQWATPTSQASTPDVWVTSEQGSWATPRPTPELSRSPRGPGRTRLSPREPRLHSSLRMVESTRSPSTVKSYNIRTPRGWL